MNKCYHTGNLTKDPEVSTTSTGLKRCTFSLAVQRTYKGANGERGADFIQFTCFDKNADIAEKYLRKGRKVLVTSAVRTGSSTVDGQRRFYTSFVVENIEFMSSAEKKSEDEAAAQPDGGDSFNNEFTPVSDDEELPF